MSTVSIGKFGEDIACKYLEQNGYKVLERNFRVRVGEIDIVTKKADCLCFVEVKTRKNDKFGLPAEAVNYVKQSKIRQCAKVYLMNYFDYSEISFDVCEVYTDDRRINYISNAF